MSSPVEVRQTIEDGVAAWEREHFEEALESFRSVLAEHPNFADIHNKAGLCLAMMSEPEEALKHFDHALELNEGYAEAHLNRGIILNELGRHDEAKVALRRAGEIDTRDSTRYPSALGNELADGLSRLGVLYMRADEPRKAVEHYREALDIRPRFQDIRTRYAGALMEVGEVEQARTELETVLEARPFMADARVMLGVALQRLGEKEAAIEAWKRCAVDAPEDMRPRAYLASVGVELDEAWMPPDSTD